jgi:hypothetical protein
MTIDLKKIINIKTKQELNVFLSKYKINDPLLPLFRQNCIFHYFVMLGNLDGLKLKKFPVFLENNDGLNCFHLAAKESHIDILDYLIANYPEYIYNRNKKKETFLNYLDSNDLIYLLEKYKTIDWYDLIYYDFNKSLLQNIITNLNYNDLTKILKLINIKVTIEEQYLFYIIYNNLLNTEEKINLLNNYSDAELSTKNIFNDGIILAVFNINDEKLLDYLLSRNIDLNYIDFNGTNTPLTDALSIDILNNTNIFTLKIINKIKINNPNFYKEINKFNDNIFHRLLFIRINRNNQIINLSDMVNINYDLDFEIFNYSDSEVLNQLNINKISPLELLVSLDYDIYYRVIKPDLLINSNIVNNVEKIPNIDINWVNLYKSHLNTNLITTDENDIKIDDYPYVHCTLFRAKSTDALIYLLYLINKYKDLYLPNINSHLLSDLRFDGTYSAADQFFFDQPIFPWYISYHSETEYYIHPYLNVIINKVRHLNKKRFAVVFLSLKFYETFHANILIYDFKNMSIERFEPYGGNITYNENKLDKILTDELAWNTGLQYIKPTEYIPNMGFQIISDENSLYNLKPGDFGGFCLAWCIWYLEIKLRNANINSKKLVEKLISKLNSLDIKYNEYIRNYSNTLNEQRNQYFKELNIDSKIISNDNIPTKEYSILVTSLVEKFIDGLDKN